MRRSIAELKALESMREDVDKKNKGKCPSCGRTEEHFFRDKFFNTLQCICGTKFFNKEAKG
jgi:hypothetical protein